MEVRRLWLLLALPILCADPSTASRGQGNQTYAPLASPDLRPGRSLRQTPVRSDLKAAWGGNPPAECSTAHPNTIVRWDAKARRCRPNVCGGAVLTDIRDLNGKASVRNLCAGPLFDSKRTLKCLKGKNVLFLGDSTLQEQVMDIAALLSELTYNETGFRSFVTTMATYIHGYTSPTYDLPLGVSLNFHSGNHSWGRDFIVRHAPHNTTIRFRFTGHHKLDQNHEGISSFLNPDLLTEFACELAALPSPLMKCNPLDALVCNSGQHDASSQVIPAGLHVPWFNMYLDSVLALLSPHQAASKLAEAAIKSPNKGGAKARATPFKVIWRGNTLCLGSAKGAILSDLDQVARAKVSAVGIPFLETAAVMRSTPGFPACCTHDGIHIGSHEYMKYNKRHNKPNEFTASSLVTNMVLRSMCPMPHIPI
ncbi:MAG: hypothetical protein WDW36_008627 [Sanguina aurantia]